MVHQHKKGQIKCNTKKRSLTCINKQHACLTCFKMNNAYNKLHTQNGYIMNVHYYLYHPPIPDPCITYSLGTMLQFLTPEMTFTEHIAQTFQIYNMISDANQHKYLESEARESSDVCSVPPSQNFSNLRTTPKHTRCI